MLGEDFLDLLGIEEAILVGVGVEELLHRVGGQFRPVEVPQSWRRAAYQDFPWHADRREPAKAIENGALNGSANGPSNGHHAIDSADLSDQA